ncbi:MAG: PDZ domain-containing protein [Proteobacteria bacterium]|nr:PDZ domain-containing protein [Pseudomonadota bacterium]
MAGCTPDLRLCALVERPGLNIVSVGMKVILSDRLSLRRVTLFALAVGCGLLMAHAQTTDVRRDATVTSVERAMPSVVNIATTTVVDNTDPYFRWRAEFFGYRVRPQLEEVPSSVGSGVIIDENGYVLTNEHVVKGANKIWVKLMDGREIEAERVTGTTKTDVALLKLKAKDGDKFTPVRFAADDDLLLGETVITLGNPFGLGGSVSKGILSSKSRRPATEDSPLEVADWLQTDAAINPGNSGGPLINVRGELIGLNVAVYREGHGIGFAIPIKRVNEALSRYFTPEGTKALWFGARVRSGASLLEVTAVEPASPADKGGLRIGDIILQVAGKVPRNFIEFMRELNAAGSKEPVSLLIRRAGAQQTLSVRLVPERDFFNAELVRQKLGLHVQELTRDLAANMGFPFYGGFVVADVDKDSPGAEANMEKYFVVKGVDNQPLRDLVELGRALHTKRAGETARLNVIAPPKRGSFGGFREGTVAVKVK